MKNTALKTEWRDIGPDLAQEFLLRNTNNRTRRPTTAARYARDMATGRWKETHQGILIARDGTILDGQHRLAAIVASGVTVRMLVTTGADPVDIVAVDCGSTRGVHDQMQVQGHGAAVVSRSGSAIGGSMVRSMGTGRLNKMTRQELIEFIEKYADSINFADETILSFTRNHTRLASSVIGAVVARAHAYGENPGTLSRFVEVLISGTAANASERAAIALRDYLLIRSANHVHDNRRTLHRKIERALRGFIDGENMTRLYAASEELWPLAEEIAFAEEAAARARKRA